MSEFRVNSITNQDGSAGPQVCGVSTFTGNYGVRIPSGSSDFRRQDGGGRGRCVAAGGASPSYLSSCEKVEIATTGNATDFGDLSGVRAAMDGCSSSTRGVIGGGGTPSNTKIIEYITMSHNGDAKDFGDLTTTKTRTATGSSPTRGVFMGGAPGQTNNIDYFDNIDNIESYCGTVGLVGLLDGWNAARAKAEAKARARAKAKARVKARSVSVQCLMFSV